MTTVNIRFSIDAISTNDPKDLGPRFTTSARHKIELEVSAIETVDGEMVGRVCKRFLSMPAERFAMFTREELQAHVNDLTREVISDLLGAKLDRFVDEHIGWRP